MAQIAIPPPRKAEKRRVKLKMAVQGPSGSGKTWGALALAKNLWPDAKVCVIDTENESASLYADRFEFDTIPLGPPFGTDRYLACIDLVVKSGYDVLIIDSITAQWDGEGGILRRKEEMDRRPGSNGYANWASFTPEHEAFKQIILQAPLHVICTMRSKQDYILVANDKGKQVPKKVGMAPIQRDQMDYEFTLVFDIEMDHKGAVSKDRTGLFNEKVVDLASPSTAEAIREWLARGNDTTPVTAEPIMFPGKNFEPPVAKSPEQIAAEAKWDKLDPPTENGPFNQVGDRLTCVIRGVTDKLAHPGTPKEKKYVSVIFNGRIDGFNFATCFDTGLFDALRSGIGKECELYLKYEKGDKFINVSDISSIDGVEYVEGKPVSLLKRQLKAALALESQ